MIGLSYHTTYVVTYIQSTTCTYEHVRVKSEEVTLAPEIGSSSYVRP